MNFHYKASDTPNQEMFPCRITFSKRKSISIQIKEDGSVDVKAPLYAPKWQVEAFVQSKLDWINQKRQEVLERQAALPTLTAEQEKRALSLEKQFRKAAKDYIPYRVEYFHAFTGGHYTSITIRDQKSRWGSCSSRGTLSFNYRLMMAPPKVLDYVVVHELCHLTHMNHSADFWKMVENIMPDYRTQKNWLKEHGHELTVQARVLNHPYK